MKLFTKGLCNECPIADDCCCRRESEEAVNKCGMDEVNEHNRRLRTRSQTYDNPEYVEYMRETYG
ncbi:MAG: hypothetical protein ACYTEQ_29055 [Planctomycetota bacterium]